jgi:hypothetical protein
VCDRDAAAARGWRKEQEAELRFREFLLADWDKLNWTTKLDLFLRSTAIPEFALLQQLLGAQASCLLTDWRNRCFKICVTACECW